MSIMKTLVITVVLSFLIASIRTDSLPVVFQRPHAKKEMGYNNNITNKGKPNMGVRKLTKATVLDLIRKQV